MFCFVSVFYYTAFWSEKKNSRKQDGARVQSHPTVPGSGAHEKTRHPAWSFCLLFESVQSYSANGAYAYAGTAVDASIGINLSLAFIVQCNRTCGACAYTGTATDACILIYFCCHTMFPPVFFLTKTV